MKFRMRSLAVLFLAGFLFHACASKGKIPKPLLGSPAHHVENGFKLLEMEKYDAAFREFRMASELGPNLASAHLGMGLALAYQGEYQKGLASLERARLQAVEPGHQVEVFIGFMRLYTLGNTKMLSGWLTEVEQAFEKTQKLDPGAPGPHFFMGLAYKQAGLYEEAEKAFIRVFEIGKGFVEAADREYTTVQRLKSPFSR